MELAALLLLGCAEAHSRWAETQGLPDSPVILADVRAFGVSHDAAEAVKCSSHSARIAMEAEVRCWNPPDVYRTYLTECEWRRMAWQLLTESLREEKSWGPWWADGWDRQSPVINRRLRSADDLRRHIGDEAFFAGVMPSPFVTYRRFEVK